MVAQKCEYLSLDLWDTVLRRRCHPDEIKLHTAQRLLFLLGDHCKNDTLTPMNLLHLRRDIEYQIARQARNMGFDDEYAIEEVLDALITLVADHTMRHGARRQLRDELVRGEIHQEIAVSFLDRDLMRLLEHYTYNQLILISDFYMSAEKIKRILAAKQVPLPFNSIFVSCDAKLNKKSGRLFHHVLNRLGTDPQSIIHIGDNLQADIEMARKTGLRTYHFTGTIHHTCRIDKEKFFTSRCNPGPGIGKDLKQRLQKHAFSLQKNHGKNGLFREGVELALIFAGFALYIQEICYRKKHQHVFFFTREGIFFKKIFDRIQRHNPYRLSPVTSHLLPVSRLSTFFPSLREISCHELMRLWSQYHTQSMHALFNSLGQDATSYRPTFLKHGIDINELVTRPWQDHRVQLLFNDPDFRDRLTRIQQKKRERLLRFFNSQEFGLQSKALIVDIGWRGTIQDNIAFLFPQVSIDGVYLGLQKFFNPQPPNTTKFAYIANANEGDTHPMLVHVIPMEMLCYGPGGSTIGYREDTNGQVHPEYGTNDHQFYRQWISTIQEGVLAGTDYLCRLIRIHGLSVAELRHISSDMAAKFICDPPPSTSKAFFALKQDDTFGMNRVIVPGKRKPRLRDKALGYLIPSRREKFLRELQGSDWPQGVLRHSYGGTLYHLGRLKTILKNCFSTKSIRQSKE